MKADIKKTKAQFKEIWETFSHSPIPSLVLSKQGKIVYYNNAMEKLTGYTHREVPDIGAWMPKLYPDEKYRNHVIEVCRKSRQREIEVISEEFVITRKNGEKRAIEFYVVDIIKDGKPTDFQISQGIDITERKRVEEALRESKRLFEKTFASLHDAVFIVDADTTGIIDCNTAASEIFGYSRQEMLGRTTAFLHVDEAKLKEFRGYLHTAVEEKGALYLHEFRMKRKDGAVFPTEHSVIPFVDEQGRRIGWVSVVRDITARKRTEEALRERDEFNFALFQHNPIETIVTDLEGRVVKCNIAKKKSGDRIPNIGDVMYRDYAGKHAIDMYTEMMECIRMGKLKEFPELKYGDRFMLIKMAPFSKGAIITSQDITDSKKAEMQLREDKRKLRSLALELTASEDRERRRIAEFLHDMISQALVVIRMKLGTLQELKDPEKAAALNKEICDLFEQAIESTRSITFDLSSPVLDKLGFEPAAEWLCEKMAEDHGLAIDFRSDSGTINLDDDMKRFLYRSVRELLMNVVKHANAHIAKVSVRRKEGMLCITVDDDGDGFRETLEDNLYLECGFGLFSIRERLDYLGGRMEIDSKPGCGTCISLYAPLGKKPTQKKQEQP